MLRTLFLAALAALLVAAPAGADTVRLDLSSTAAKALKQRGVTVAALAPARRWNRRVTLPVAGPGTGGVELRGALRLERGKRTASVTALELQDATILSGRISGPGGRRCSSTAG